MDASIHHLRPCILSSPQSFLGHNSSTFNFVFSCPRHITRHGTHSYMNGSCTEGWSLSREGETGAEAGSGEGSRDWIILGASLMCFSMSTPQFFFSVEACIDLQPLGYISDVNIAATYIVYWVYVDPALPHAQTTALRTAARRRSSPWSTLSTQHDGTTTTLALWCIP